MEYSKIIAVTGLPGLHELISSKTDGAIVRSLDDKSTKFVSSRIHNFSHLESIEIYTVRENANLVDIFKAMETSNESLPDDRDAKAVKTYFEKVYPDIDFDRVYNSDMKKMIKWYSTLKANNIELKLSEPPEEEPVAVEETAAVEVIAKPKQKAAAAPKKEEKETKKSEQAPKKKAPALKVKKEEKEEKKSASKSAPAAKKKAAPKKDETDKKDTKKKSSTKKK